MTRAWVMQIALAVFTISEEDGNVDSPIVKGESKLAISYFSSFKTLNLIERNGSKNSNRIMIVC